MSAKIKENRDKILFWLKEELLSPEEIVDPNAYFNFKIKQVDLWLNVIQSVHSVDSFIIGTKWILGNDQLNLHKNIMDNSKRIAYYWDLQFTLLNDSQLGEFQISPKPPHDFKELFVSSNPIFYDNLTKQNLMSSIFAVHKAMVKSVFLLEKYGGVFPPYSPIPEK